MELEVRPAKPEEKLRLSAEPVVATVRKRNFGSLKGRVFGQLHKR